MSLEIVSITGADDHVEIDSLAALSAKYPFVEWALLYFPEKEGAQRSPSAIWREKFISAGFPRVAAHLCGTQVFVDLLMPGSASARISDLSRYRRVQLNINARRQDFSDAQVLAIYHKLHSAGIGMILQHHAGSERVIEQFLGEIESGGKRRAGVDLLFDASKGTGKLPDVWPVPQRNQFCGYAGGLGPDVLGDELPRIEAAATQPGRNLPYWVDMESGVRTNNAFDLQKVERVLEICQGWQNR